MTHIITGSAGSGKTYKILQRIVKSSQRTLYSSSSHDTLKETVELIRKLEQELQIKVAFTVWVGLSHFERDDKNQPVYDGLCPRYGGLERNDQYITSLINENTSSGIVCQLCRLLNENENRRIKRIKVANSYENIDDEPKHCDNCPHLEQFSDPENIVLCPIQYLTTQRVEKFKVIVKGYVPEDIGNTMDEQLHSFMKIIREFHDISREFVKSENLVLCHDDLSPCNVVFLNNDPVTIIDWKDVHPNEPWQDLTYILWLWINIGSHTENRNLVSQMSSALEAYGADEDTKQDFSNKLIKRMSRTLIETDKTRKDYEKIREWVQYSTKVIENNSQDIQKGIG